MSKATQWQRLRKWLMGRYRKSRSARTALALICAESWGDTCRAKHTRFRQRTVALRSTQVRKLSGVLFCETKSDCCNFSGIYFVFCRWERQTFGSFNFGGVHGKSTDK